MVKLKPVTWFFLIMLLYFIVRYLRVNCSINSDFLNYYLTDLFFVPAMCFFSLSIIRWIKKDDTIEIKTWMILTQVVFVSIYFEWYLPDFKNHIHPYTSDFMDVIMYFLGGVLFMIMQKRAL